MSAHTIHPTLTTTTHTAAMSHTDQVEHEHERDGQCDVFVGALLGYTNLSDNQSRIANDVENSHHMPRNIPMLDERVRPAAEASKVRIDEYYELEYGLALNILRPHYHRIGMVIRGNNYRYYLPSKTIFL